MAIFENEKYDKFFNPLSCRNKQIYYECIVKLIEASMMTDLLNETDARDVLILYFRNCAYAVAEEFVSEDVEDSISSKKTAEENASAVLRYFRQCGWICKRELARNGDNLATVDSNCRKLIGAVDRIFNRDTQAAVTNHIFYIYDVLHSAFNIDHGRTIRPYSNILIPMREAVADLKNELQSLKDSIRSIMRIILNLRSANELGRLMAKDEVLQLFFSDYFFIKKDGLIPTYIAEIENMLNDIKNQDIYDRIVKELQVLEHHTEEEARYIVERQFNVVRQFISYDYGKAMDDIDERINNYYNLYATRMLMVISDTVNLQSYINKVLLYLKDVPLENRQNILAQIGMSFELQSYKYIGSRSIMRRRKRRPNTQSGAIAKSTVTEEELARLTKELLQEQPDRYSVQETKIYFDNLMVQREQIAPTADIVKSKHDALMMAASIIYSGSAEFPYEVEFLDGKIATPIATFNNFKLIKKKRGDL